MCRQTSMRDSGRAQTNQKKHYSCCIFLMTTPHPQNVDAFWGSFCCFFHLFYCIFSPARSFFIGFHCIFCVPSRPRIERYCTWSKQNKTTIFVVLLEKSFAHRTLLHFGQHMRYEFVKRVAKTSRGVTSTFALLQIYYIKDILVLDYRLPKADKKTTPYISLIDKYYFPHSNSQIK